LLLAKVNVGVLPVFTQLIKKYSEDMTIPNDRKVEWYATLN